MRLNILTPISSLGYGVTGSYITDAFVKKGHDPTLFTIGQTRPDKNFLHLQSRMFGTGRHHYDPSAPMIRNFHEFSVFFPPGSGMKIVWPFFEVDKLRPSAVVLLNQVDAVASASEWKDEVLKSNGVTTRLFRAYQGVDTDVFKPLSAVGVDIPQTNVYKFLTLGKFEVRKGHPELIQAFKMAFPTEQDVVLYMMVHNPFMGPGTQVVEGVINRLSKGDPRIRFLPPVQTHREVATTIGSVDCCVFPTRGEGFGLSILEALSCGKPVIATFVTSHKEFLDHDVAYEVATDGLVVANDNKFFHGVGRWYQPNVKSIADQMRKAYDKKWRENPKGREKALEFTWSRSVDMLLEGIQGGGDKTTGSS